MFSRWQWIMRQIGRSLRLRVILFCAIAVATALAGLVLDELIPDHWSASIGSGAVFSLLEIIASSMLAVTIFSRLERAEKSLELSHERELLARVAIP